jgi:hypothetical protein
LAGRRLRELEQFGQHRRPSLMHGRADRHLDRFQIEAAGFVAAAEQDAQELVYFARDFPVDRFGRFFPWPVCGSGSAERVRQISVLV